MNLLIVNDRNVIGCKTPSLINLQQNTILYFIQKITKNNVINNAAVSCFPSTDLTTIQNMQTLFSEIGREVKITIIITFLQEK